MKLYRYFLTRASGLTVTYRPGRKETLIQLGLLWYIFDEVNNVHWQLMIIWFCNFVLPWNLNWIEWFRNIFQWNHLQAIAGCFKLWLSSMTEVRHYFRFIRWNSHCQTQLKFQPANICNIFRNSLNLTRVRVAFPLSNERALGWWKKLLSSHRKKNS